jgi:CTD small phosphatase-like protein 2
MENILGNIDKASVINLAQKLTKNILSNKSGNNKGNNDNNKNDKSNLLYSNFLPNKVRSKSVNAMISNIVKQKNEKKENKNSEKEINELKELMNPNNVNNIKTLNMNNDNDINININSFNNNDNNNKQNYSRVTNNNNNYQKQNSLNSEIDEIIIKQEGKLRNNNNNNCDNYDNLSRISTNSVDVKSTYSVNYPTNRISFLTSRIGLISSKEKLFYRFNHIKNNLNNNETRPSTSYSNKTTVKTFTYSEYKNETENKKINDIDVEKLINLNDDENTNYFKKKYINKINHNKANLLNNNNDISKTSEKEDNNLLKHNNNPLSLNIINNNTLKSNFNYNLNRNYKKSDKSLINNINFRKNPLKLTAIKNFQNNEINNNNDEYNFELEDLIVLEEKLYQIYESFVNGKPLFNLCIEWWNFYMYCNFGYKFENLFYNDKDYNITHESSMLELLSIIIFYEILMNIKYSNSDINLMKNLLFDVYQNYLIICDYVLNKVNFDLDKKIFINKLQNLIFAKLEHKIKNNEYLHLLKTNNSSINNKLKLILKLFNNNDKISTVNFYYKKIGKISLKTLNEYFCRKISSDCLKTGDVLTFNNNSQQNSNFSNDDNTPFLNFAINEDKTFTLVLDLDETLINYRIDELGRAVLRPRPHLYRFLKELNRVYELIIFTAGTQEYADPILDEIEKKHKFFEKRLYRQHCIIIDNIYVKDLSKLGRDLSKIIIVDNMKQNFKLQKENGIFIKNFFGDRNDSTLNELLPILLEIAKNKDNDVREELAKFKNEIFTKITTNLKNENNFLS